MVRVRSVVPPHPDLVTLSARRARRRATAESSQVAPSPTSARQLHTDRARGNHGLQCRQGGPPPRKAPPSTATYHRHGPAPSTAQAILAARHNSKHIRSHAPPLRWRVYSDRRSRRRMFLQGLGAAAPATGAGDFSRAAQVCNQEGPSLVGRLGHRIFSSCRPISFHLGSRGKLELAVRTPLISRISLSCLAATCMAGQPVFLSLLATALDITPSSPSIHFLRRELRRDGLQLFQVRSSWSSRPVRLPRP